jgi:hypothetical protein
LVDLKRRKTINNNQRIAVAVSLVFIGLVLLSLMVEYGDGRGIRFGTRIITFYTKVLTPWDDEREKLIPSQAVTTHFGLYIRNGIPGILLGLITPLGLWAVAAYVALGWKKEAAFNLGVMYTNGWGVPQDYVRAHMWLNLSAAQGDQDAARDRDDIATRMTPAQIAEAQKLAREWQPKRP